MSVLRSISIEDIDRRSDCRAPDDDTIAALADSIEQVGLINPIRVRQKGQRFELIAGSHRFAACDVLEFREIPALVVDDDDLHAELAMIDENLCRAEITGTLLDQQIARRKEIYEALHPEARREATLRRGDELPSRQVGETGKIERFTAATAAMTGRSERSIQRSAERGAKIAPEAANLMQGTSLDTGRYGDSIKDLSPAEQVEKVRHDLAEPRRPTVPPPVPQRPQPGAAFVRFGQLVDELEALRIADIIAGAGRQRSVLGQRASGLADMMNDIMEGLNR